MVAKLEKVTRKLKNGFEIQVIQMPNFNQIYGLVMVNFGSVNTLLEDGEQLPAGIAHFIEHKLFAKPGYDVSEKFAEYGANTNAYTSYTKTAYLFQTIENPYDNLRILLDLVSNPYFTKKNVNSERGIIDQEIQMYLDMPEWVLEQKILSQLYPNDPISADIAGTSESLKEINNENLLSTYYRYYQPKNMNLVLVGNVDIDKVEEIVNEFDLEATDPMPNKIMRPFEPISDGGQNTMEISQSRSSFGIRVDLDKTSKSLVELQFEINMVMETLVGESSDYYEELTNSGIIDDSFSYNVVAENNYCFVIISGTTPKPDEFREFMSSHLTTEILKNALTATKFQQIKLDAIGSYVFAQNSPESIANQVAELYFYDTDYLKLIDIIDGITINDLNEVAELVLNPDNYTYYHLLSEKK
ncbi:EF-P 5-aminopentanol modification-associated protein YfmH [Companilactobacillus metriopterae]|uniref:EF-P 5-aminopentanol modification-associated protein YfmH n=1 Tax=Companilactobacillus metriopterae TaxID=1909267 RepID=UPI00100A9BDD|nr:pitrilysin family protein [Companilactobacillus metriopterae]